MEHIELVVFGLLVAVAGLAVVARFVLVPYPILLVLGGLGIGAIPGVPEVELDPDIVLLTFLPPLLYSAAFFSNLRELRANAGSIGLLAVGLVIATTVAVAAVAHAVVGLDWPAAFVLGAVVSPTDAVAPAAILRRLGAPRRVVTLVEGENLTNDWTALVTYKFAVAAVTAGTFSLGAAAGKFVVTGLGGIAVGVVVGVVISAVRRRLDDPPTEVTISLLTAYAAYLPAEELGVSGVMAAVTVGVVLGWQASELTTHTTRIQLSAIWEMLQFLLNAVLFVLVGLQLPIVLEAIQGRSTGELLGYGLAVTALVVVVRMVWVYAFAYLPKWISPRVREPDALLDFGSVTLVAWSGMRGAVCLAAALAIPVETNAHAPFPDRELVIFLAFCVILVTLVGQGLTMPLVIRGLGVEDDGLDADEELSARIETAFAAIDRIEQLEGEDWVHPETLSRARALFDYRRRRFSSRVDGGRADEDDFDYEARSVAYARLMHDVIGAQRRRLRELRDRGEITDDVRRRVEYALDLEEARLEV